jgi:hypothetical protein
VSDRQKRALLIGQKQKNERIKKKFFKKIFCVLGLSWVLGCIVYCGGGVALHFCCGVVLWSCLVDIFFRLIVRDFLVIDCLIFFVVVL